MVASTLNDGWRREVYDIADRCMLSEPTVRTALRQLIAAGTVRLVCRKPWVVERTNAAEIRQARAIERGERVEALEAKLDRILTAVERRDAVLASLAAPKRGRPSRLEPQRVALLESLLKDGPVRAEKVAMMGITQAYFDALGDRVERGEDGLYRLRTVSG